MAKDLKIDFRCTVQEKEKVKKMSKEQDKNVHDYLLDATIYKNRRKNRRTNKELTIVSNILTYVNQIEDGVNVSEAIANIRKEGEKLWQL